MKIENKDEGSYKNNEKLCMGWGFKIEREKVKVYYVCMYVHVCVG